MTASGIVLRSRPLLTVLVVWNVVMLGVGAINVAEVALAKVALDSGDLGFGILVGAGGLGLTVGSFFSGRLVDRLGIGRVYFYGIALMAIGYGSRRSPRRSGWRSPAVVLAAVGNGAAVVCNALFVQRGAPDELRGRAFTVIMSTNYALLGVGMVAGRLADRPLRRALGLGRGGCRLPAGCACSWSCSRRADAEAEP